MLRSMLAVRRTRQIVFVVAAMHLRRCLAAQARGRVHMRLSAVGTICGCTRALYSPGSGGKPLAVVVDHGCVSHRNIKATCKIPQIIRNAWAGGGGEG